MNKKLKTTLIILASMLAFALAIWLMNKANEDKPFNKVIFTESNFVKNKTNMKYLDTLVLAGLHALKIDKTSVLILPLDVQSTQDLELKAHIVRIENGYIIFIKEVDRNYALEIISHELIHLRQYGSGELYVNILTNELIFKQRVYSINNLPAYDVRPWEIEAFAKQTDLRSEVIDILY
jgi:hypothetical protein